LSSRFPLAISTPLLIRGLMTKSHKPRLKVGDLVCMFRRRKAGLGIVLEYHPDVGVCMEREPREVYETYKDFEIKDWRSRDEYKKRVCAESCNPDLVFDFFLYNAAFAGKLKTSFAFVRWVKKPSTYEADAVYSHVGWFPAEWLKAY